MGSRGYRGIVAALAALALAGCGGGGGDAAPAAGCPVVIGTSGSTAFVPASPPTPLTQVSGASPFAPGCGHDTVCGGTLYAGAEVEPFVAVHPLDASRLVGVWQQDRWSNGGAQGLLAAFSTDGGQTWATRQAPFTRCSGGNAVNGGDYARATDPWVTVGADGTVYWMAMAITDLASGDEISAMRVSRSTNGGNTWSAPVTLIQDSTPFLNDKNSITADPANASYVYAVWDRLNYATNSGPAYYTRTTNGGITWEAARVLYDPGLEAQTIGNQIVVLSDGTLIDLFTEIQYGTSTTPDSATLRVVRSVNHGATWSAPVSIAPLQAIGAYDPETGIPIRDGSVLGTIAVGPDDAIWVAWQDSSLGLVCLNPPCLGPRDAIALAGSTDGGQTWSPPVRVNADDTVQAFTPAIRVAADGTIGVTYYDLRDNTSDPATLLASHWLATSADGTTWTERLVTGPFDLAIAPNALGLFLGDYVALASAGGSFLPFFTQTQPDLGNRTGVYAVALPTTVTAASSAKAGAFEYQVLALAPAEPTPELARRVGENIRRQRHDLPDHIRPGQVPRYLRRLG
jgi:hypothetical protein